MYVGCLASCHLPQVRAEGKDSTSGAVAELLLTCSSIKPAAYAKNRRAWRCYLVLAPSTLHGYLRNIA
jgi:hypothetical protein